MAKKQKGEMGEEQRKEWYQSLPYHEKMKVIAELTDALQEEKVSGDPRAYRRQGSARDTAVQRLAALKLYEMKAMHGMSFREIAEVAGISYERVRQLYHRFYPEAQGDKNGAERGAKEASA